jgi:2-keto-4-pentenoate hydratase/2-oxohepta-3-ene-1,7-dioic acid hydratase in catechol pathway
MKLAMIETEGRLHPAVVRPDGSLVDLKAGGLTHYDDLEKYVEEGEPALREAAAAATGDRPSVQNFRLLCPLVRPEKIMCIGRNYADHAKELGHDLPERPVLFAKFRNTLAGPAEIIPLPSASRQVDYEAELAVVVGRTCRNVSEKAALDYVFGYTCANDLTMRDAQKEDGQWTRAKSPDKFCPLGPWIVTRDEIADPQDLEIKLVLNGSTMQESNTRQMVFGVAELVSYLSATMTLRPGDLLLTGTPPGVGAGRDPQVFLKPGDRLSVKISGIGVLDNEIA